MKYRDFVENIVQIVYDYVKDVSPKSSIPEFSIETGEYFTDIRVDVGGSNGIYGIEEEFCRGREALIRVLELVKLIIEDPVLSKVVEVTILNDSSDFIRFYFVKKKDSLAQIRMIVPVDILGTTSVGKLLKDFKEIDQKIRRFRELILNGPGKKDVSTFDVLFYSNDQSKFEKTITYLVDVKEKAIRAGLGVKEIIYFKRYDSREFFKHPPVERLLAYEWRPFKQNLEIYVDLTVNYFTTETVNKLLISGEVTIEDLLQLKLKPELKADETEVNLDTEIKNPNLSEIISTHLIRRMDL